MSNVKNNDPFAAVGNLFNKVVGEAGRVVEERVRHVTEDIDSVGKAVETGGFVGGVMQGLDVLSPGHQIAHNIDSLIPGEDLPPALKEGISLGINLASGAGAVVAAKDAFDLFNEMSKKPQQPVSAGDKPAAERLQTPESPGTALDRAKNKKSELLQGKLDAIKEAKHDAIEAAKAHAKDKMYGAAKDNSQDARIKELEGRVSYLEELAGVSDTRPAGGFADGGGFISNDFISGEISGSKGPKGPKDDKMKKLEADLDKATRDIERILNDPTLSFEDMIFLLMRAVIKQSEASVKIELQQEKVGRAEDKKLRNSGRDGLQSELDGAMKKLASAKPEDRDGLQAKITEIRGRQDVGGANSNDQAEARSERFEELKESLQKVSEMQQALSNIMNTLHQTAMNAIGNIR